jgi:hypothetical protein
MKAEWNSLEVSKLCVPIMASVILALIGLKISESLATFQSAVARNDKQIDSLVQKRLALYDAIGTKLNGMFAYYMYIGRWKESSPEDMIKNKRQLDEIVYTYQPFFSPEFIGNYQDIEKQMFRSFNGWGQDAKLRTEARNRRDFYLPPEKGAAWDSKWDTHFTNEDNTAAIRTAYSKLISALPLELAIPDLSGQRARQIPVDQVAKSNVPSSKGGTSPD